MPPRSQPPTKRGLLPEARHLVLPKGLASSGFPRVEATCRAIGIEFDPWQADLNRCLLGKSKDGLYAADTAVISIARQVGKTFDIGAVAFAECIAEPETTVIWTAHRFKVSRETFNELRALAKTPLLAPHIDFDAITTAAGNECIPFRNGSRIVFAARERGAIRGFTKVRILILDEAQILTHSVLADLAPTMNQASNPLIILMGTPPKPSDPSEVFSELRKEALAQFAEHGHSEGLLYVEFSADVGADPDDLAQLKTANPSYPHRTPLRAIKRLRRLLSEADYLREVFGIWDDDALTTIPMGAWRDCTDQAGQIAGQVVLSLDMSFDRTQTFIGVCGEREDGRRQVEIAAARPGTAWVADALKQAAKEWSAPVMVATTGPAAAMIPELLDAGIEVVPVGGAELAQACGHFLDSVIERTLAHLGDEGLTSAVRGAQKRTGESFVFTRKGNVDISPLYAALLALWGWTTRHATGDILQAVW